MKINQSIFKAYDIRGKVPSEINGEVALLVGKALADFLPEGEVAVGRDMRPDSKELADSIVEGLTLQGRTVIDLGEITSDMIYFAVGKLGLAGGAMVTASHNPGEYNGIKLTSKGVEPIGVDTGLKTIESLVLRDEFKQEGKKGNVKKLDIVNDWVSFALGFAPDLSDLRIGLDAGNGMAGILMPALLDKTNLEIEGLYTELDGTFPNHPANPLDHNNLKDLISLVKTNGLDCGLAFDGDADRVFMVDENGEVVSASIVGAILAERFIKSNPGSSIIYNVITSKIVPDEVKTLGGKSIRSRVGHSYIKAEMRKTGAIFACEHSGHFYFKDFYCADSGLIAAMMVLDEMSKSGKSLSGICEPFRGKYFQSGEVNFEVTDKQKAIESIANHFGDGSKDYLDGLTVTYDNWWFNVRPSNTEPYLRLNIESENSELTKQKLLEITDIINKKY